MINIPVNDVLQLRIVGNTVRRDGFIKNLTPGGGIPSKLNDDKHDSLRFSARIKPGSSITNDIVADYYHEDDAPRQNVPVAFTAASTLRAANIYGPRTVSLGNNPSGVNLPLYNKSKIWGIADTLNWEVSDNMSIKNVLGYRNDDTDAFEDNDGSYIDLVSTRTVHKNTEWVDDFTLRLNTDDKRLRVTSGVYVSHTTKDEGAAGMTAQNFGILGFFGPPPPKVNHSKNWTQRDFHSHAIYSQVDYDLTKELTLTMGLRYNWDSGSVKVQSAGGRALPDPSGSFFPIPGVPCATGATSFMPGFNAAQCMGLNSARWKAPSYNFVLTGRFAEKSIIYFKASGGYLAGGFNTSIREPQYQTFLPEKTNAFEAGLKSDWALMGRPLRTNIDVFYGNSQNKQEIQNGSYADGTTWIAVFKAGSLTYYGTDMEAKFYPTDSLELNGLWTHIESGYDSFNFPAVGTLAAQNLGGAIPAQVPRDTVSLGLTFAWPLASSAGKLSTSFTSYYRSATKFHDVATLGSFGSNADTGPEYWTSSFNADWKGIMGTSFDASIWVKNLFDKKYLIFSSPQATLGYQVVKYGDPRTFGAHLRYNF